MDKQEVLKRAQQSPRQLDEMELDILQKSGQIGMLVGLVVCLILMWIKMHFNEPYQDIYAVYCSALCGQYLYQWVRQREAYKLMCGGIWGAVAVFLFVVYVMKIM